MTTSETISLLKKIRDGSTSDAMPMGELLRLCMRLGLQLGNKELVQWARSEASGYKEESELPDYRKMAAEVRGTFYGPFQSGVKNAHIPKSVIDKDHRDVLFGVCFFEPVSQLEQYANAENGQSTFKISWPADIIAYYSGKEICSNGLVLASAWRLMSSQNVHGLLETIRTRVLDFVLQIQDELGLDIDEPVERTESLDIQSPGMVTNIFHNSIYGGNVALSNNNEVNYENINISVGNFDELKTYLLSLGITSTEVEKLKAAIDTDGEVKRSFGTKVNGWLSKTSVKVVKKSGLKIAGAVATSLITKALMKYYGF